MKLQIVSPGQAGITVFRTPLQYRYIVLNNSMHLRDVRNLARELHMGTGQTWQEHASIFILAAMEKLI